jgi:hypothetical protein
LVVLAAWCETADVDMENASRRLRVVAVDGEDAGYAITAQAQEPRPIGAFAEEPVSKCTGDSTAPRTES